MTVDDIIRNALKVNMGHKSGERVLIVSQEWHPAMGAHTEENFSRSKLVAQTMHVAFLGDGVDSTLLSYQPTAPDHGVDVPAQFYSKVANGGHFDIAFMPTPYSISHTKFRKELCDNGSRVASMPTFTMKMFEPDGPMSADYNQVAKLSLDVARKMKELPYIHILGKGTDILVEATPHLAHVDTGLFHDRGDFGNLPAGEGYCVPKNANGYFSVPKGWGGEEPSKYNLQFRVNNGRIIDVQADDKNAQQYLKDTIHPLIFGGNNYNVLAELGIGTNHKITPEYVKKNGWTALTAEKIIDSAHFANGNSAAMGGSNDVPRHLDWVVPNVQIRYMDRPNR